MESGNAAMEMKLCVVGFLGTLTALWGWFGWLVVVWAGVMLADWIVGFAVAARDGKWSSARARTGIWHKVGEIVVVAVALVTDWLIGTLLANLPGITLPFTYGVLLGPLVMVWYVIGELGSLAEHAVTMGATVPGWLVRVLDVSREAIDHVGETLSGEKKQGRPQSWEAISPEGEGGGTGQSASPLGEAGTAKP